MNNNKIKRAAWLLDEIGNVSDVYLQEALIYRKRRAISRPWVAAVACILAVVLVGGGVLNSPWLDNFLSFDNPEEAPQAQQIASSLDGYLTTNRASINCTAITAEDITYFGSSYLVLQYEGDETLYRSRNLTSGEVNRILSLMGKGERVGTDSPNLLCRIWLICADGTTLSPYLANTDGNRGHAVLFDYEAEILPSASLISCISDILNP